MWIIEDDITLPWNIGGIDCIELLRRDDKRRKADVFEAKDNHMRDDVGEQPGKAGYVFVESDGTQGEGKDMLFTTDDIDDLVRIYNAFADSLIKHPGVVDLRGIDFNMG